MHLLAALLISYYLPASATMGNLATGYGLWVLQTCEVSALNLVQIALDARAPFVIFSPRYD